jgi:hypothetical protein
VLTADEILKEGEVFIGAYNVEIARWSKDQWAATIPPLYAILSDHRLILQPHARKQYAPAVIPTSYITGVRLLNSPRHGIMLLLKTGHRIGMFVALDPEQTLLNNLQNLKPPKRDVRFTGEFDTSTIQKLIEFLAS